MGRSGGRAVGVRADLVRIFDGESAAGLGDGELLGRFADSGDEAAFEALVGRLGPMVLGVCRRMLADPHDVEDAFQATFLVLVRRARSIRDRGLVGPWLHGVATRTARRARSASIRRSARERSAVVEEAREDDAGLGPHWPEVRALIDEEIGRLPEHHRRPVVLCDVEGLSREEAAERLGWTPNMLRGRLERARDRLRGRLARRGLAPSGSWAVLTMSPPTPTPALLAATARAAIGLAAGRVGACPASASAVALSRGVLRMMLVSKLTFGLTVAFASGLVAGSGLIAAQGPGPGNAVALPGVQEPAPLPITREPRTAEALAALGRTRVEMARSRFATQRRSYEQGRITVDRVLAASESLMNAELDEASTPDRRTRLIRAHLDRILEIEGRERAELQEGRATQADLEEIQSQRLDIEYRLAREMASAAPAEPSVVDKLARERAEIERRVSEVERKLDRIIGLLDALKR